MRSPHLHDTLRRFCLGAFAVFTRDLEDGGELPFAFEEHGSYGRPTLYEYRPLVRGYVEAHADRLRERDDVRQALEELRREPGGPGGTHLRRSLSLGARAAARAHRRRLRRLRLGRRGVRPRVRGARGVAL